MSTEVTEFFRDCPECNTKLYYGNPYSRDKCQKENRLCRKCSCRKRNSNPTWKQKNVEMLETLNKKQKGKNNPFYGKHHTEENKKLFSESNTGRVQSEESCYKKSLASQGNNNSMAGRSVFDVWVEKYGKEIADQKLEQFRKKCSDRMQGKSNPMYGISPAYQAGKGISGWYKKTFFRSLRELCYIVNVLEKSNLPWKTAESNEYRIEYTDEMDKARTYSPDFIVNNTKLVEIKPLKLQTAARNVQKQKYAALHCLANNLDYEVVDCEVDTVKIKELYLNGSVTFTDKSESRYKAYFL